MQSVHDPASGPYREDQSVMVVERHQHWMSHLQHYQDVMPLLHVQHLADGLEQRGC